MREREGFPAGVPAWIDTQQADVDAAARFYGGLFGWSFEDASAEKADGRYVVARRDGRRVAGIGSAPRAATGGQGWMTYVAVDSADASAERVQRAGGRILATPFDRLDLARVAVCADPSGATFGLWEPRAIKGAEAVNVPNAWNFSELNTRDIDGARRFYGAVFGWEADEVDMGAMTGTMVRLPGYADFLEQFDPGLRQRHADFGAPPGFSECVAWMLPLDEAEAEAKPHWSVTFTVADTDAIAARASELGGTVAVPPFDVPPVRSAVLLDPAGARFTVNAFNPG